MADHIRVGNVSNVKYKKGLIEVTYPDLDDSVTDALPVFSLTGEYKMPKIGDEVLVVHLSNGETAGIVLGKFWGGDEKPMVYGKNVFRKELGDTQGECYIQYKDGKLSFKSPEGSTTLGSILQRLAALEARL